MPPHADIESLLAAAEKALSNAIAPYSGFRVGAAILTAGGEVFTGCNIENPSLMMSFCAEKVALLKALSEGHRKFAALAVVSSEGDYCYPCGSCRQLLHEFAPDIAVILKSGSGKGIKEMPLKELLPYPFIK